jgi:hypothetical protein
VALLGGSRIVDTDRIPEVLVVQPFEFSVAVVADFDDVRFFI